MIFKNKIHSKIICSEIVLCLFLFLDIETNLSIMPWGSAIIMFVILWDLVKTFNSCRYYFFIEIFTDVLIFMLVLTCSIILYLKFLKWNGRNKIENRKDFWSNESNISVTSRLRIARCFNNYNLCNNSWVDRNIEFLTLKFNCEKINLL